MSPVAETTIGVWRGSKANLHFWVQTIVTLSLYYWIVYRNNDITLTNLRVTQRWGNLLGRREATLTIDSITDVTVRVSFLGEIFRYGDVRILTAGSRQSEIGFYRLENPNGLREAIFAVRNGQPVPTYDVRPTSRVFEIFMLLVVLAVIVALVVVVLSLRR